MERPHFIYALVDPRDEQIRYVGMSTNPGKRKIHHDTNYDGGHNAEKKKWVAELRALGLRPILRILEECDFHTWRNRERFWITHLREQGCTLLNIRSGGDTISWRTKEQYEWLRQRFKGKPRPASVGAKVSASLKGHAVSEETRQKLREANKRQFSDPEARARHSEAVKNWSAQLSPEKKARCKVGLQVGMPLAHEALRDKWATVSEEERKDWITRSHKWLSDPANSEKQRQKALKRWSKT